MPNSWIVIVFMCYIRIVSLEIFLEQRAQRTYVAAVAPGIHQKFYFEIMLNYDSFKFKFKY